MSRLTVLQGDWVERLKELPSGSVHCCVTSPPYWGLRDYGVGGQLGLEKSPEEYVVKLVAGFAEVKRVLRDDGTLWLNLGDSYGGYYGDNYAHKPFGDDRTADASTPPNKPSNGKMAKQLQGIPWRVAFALQADGWYLRSDIIWAKKNCMPESVTDRPTKSHEYLFLLSKSQRYFYDSEAIKEPSTYAGKIVTLGEKSLSKGQANGACIDASGNGKANQVTVTQDRNKRSVWTVATAPYSEAHFATFPPDLIKPCILAGTSAKGCCPHCGAPWERVVDVDYIKNRPSAGDDPRSRNEDRATQARGHGGWRGNNLLRDATTTGWEPGCDCGYGELKPCTVLDPFAGSGTTGMVALELGRKAILIELSEAYCKLLKDRTNVTPGLPLA